MTYLHDPQARLDYSWDWAAWLAAGETITAHSLAPTTGVTVEASAVAGGVVTAWVTATVGGTITCHITTSQGRQDDRTIILQVVDR